jgi:hypothetical protein
MKKQMKPGNLPANHNKIIAALLFITIFAANNIFAVDPPCYITQWGSWGSGNGQFSSPFAIEVDGGGNVFVVDYGILTPNL